MSTPTPLTITTADEQHRPQLEQLWTMFRHEMPAYTGTSPTSTAASDKNDSMQASPNRAGQRTSSSSDRTRSGSRSSADSAPRNT